MFQSSATHMARIDPLNKKQYGAVTAMLAVSDIKAAMTFYQKAFGFAKRGFMTGPGGKPLHGELTLRDTTLMLAPEDPERGLQNAKTAGASPTSLYLLTESVDKIVAKAVSLGAAAKGEVADMFWGDRCGTVVDPDGYTWTVATHMANPTPEKMKEQMRAQTAGPEKGRDSSADEVSPKTGTNRNKRKE